MKDVADKFVRVRLTRVDNVDLNLFEFDYDLTFMVFFLNHEGKVYARYGGRDSWDADNRQSLAGLNYTMKSVLEMHNRAQKIFAPRSVEKTKYAKEISKGIRVQGCMHCHQVKEALHAELKRTGQWERDLAFRFPLPENVGLTLEVDRGNVVKEVAAQSPAQAAGLKPGDVLRQLHGVPIHSFGDAQFALDKSPKVGAVEVVWQRDGKELSDKLALAAGWKKTNIAWRPSLMDVMPSIRLYGRDLKGEERKELGLSPTQLAFRQKDQVSAQAKAAGILAGDIILGLNDVPLEMSVDDFLRHVQGHYLVGDKVSVNLIREGKRVNMPMTLGR